LRLINVHHTSTRSARLLIIVNTSCVWWVDKFHLQLLLMWKFFLK